MNISAGMRVTIQHRRALSDSFDCDGTFWYDTGRKHCGVVVERLEIDTNMPEPAEYGEAYFFATNGTALAPAP
jgi:hypothetical protein